MLLTYRGSAQKEKYELNPFRSHSSALVGSRPPVHRHPATAANRRRLLQVSLWDPCTAGALIGLGLTAMSFGTAMSAPC
jgi:hypothetical protein